MDEVLQETLWKLLGGELELHNLSAGLQAWYVAGVNVHGANCCAAALDRMRFERDLWYECAANGWTPGEALRRRTDALWAEGVSA